LVENPDSGKMQYNVMWIKNPSRPNAAMVELIMTLEGGNDDLKRLGSQIAYTITNDIDNAL
jgi:hypothetical protein